MKKFAGVVAALFFVCLFLFHFCDLKDKIPFPKEEEDRRGSMVDALGQTFRERGIDVNFDGQTGEINLNAAVLFGGDSAALSEEGKNSLREFFTVFAEIAFSEEYEGLVTKVVVEGHSAPLATSTYESGLPLSQERAANVRDYCLSEEIGLDAALLDKLSDKLVAEGLSNSKPILDENGEVNLEASRRVTFRFYVEE